MRDTTRRLCGNALLVEDESLVALDMEDLLAGFGLTVVGPAARLGEAVRLAGTTAELGVAVLDVNLAGEMSWPVARALKARGVPFVFVTGYIEQHADLPPDLAGSRILSKPVDPDELCRTLGGLLRRAADD